ncbi:class I SAM-dependent methyltransferase [Thermoactinospora rubra]|uniref:class I SAM-dependent methyltransferase n=1 Tax=Thermoactinospora rubra TaxID=1088767 RepID=UPI00117F3D92|nr:class I SAM-dependent methyltransferase [Thermoactinospora rubra]
MGFTRKMPEIMHRSFFGAVSALGSHAQGAILRRYFDWWHRRPDPWNLASDAYEQHKYLTTISRLPARPYPRILEVGCSEGVFTELLARTYPEAQIAGVDISRRALDRARRRTLHAVGRVRFVHADILELGVRGGFHLVFCAETLYYLGRDSRLGRAAERLGEVLVPGGVLVLVHPWPEARRLHAFVDTSPAVCKIDEHVEPHAVRPFAVSLYEAA